jgi:SM-20-related protein
MITILKNVLDESLAKDAWDSHISGSWKWGYNSTSNKMVESIPHFSLIHAGVTSYTQKYYNCENELSGTILEIWNVIKKHLDSNDELVRCYANLITIGLDQRMHFDDENPNSKTIIIYLNDTWNVDWSGETVFWDRNNREIIKSVLPKFNTAVLFSGNIWHGVRPVSIFCRVPRITLMFKTQKVQGDINVI